ARRDLLADAVDHLLEPADDGQIAVAVEEALVARSEPTCRKRLGIGLRVVRIRVDYALALDDDLASVTGRCQPAGAVHDPDPNAGGEAHRARPAVARRLRVRGHLAGGFGHAVGLEHRRAEARFQLPHGLG